MNKLTSEQIEKAVEWWAGAIRNPKFDGLSREEREDSRNDSYQLAEMMATIASKPKMEQQIEIFKVELAAELSSAEYHPSWGLGVDYGPCRQLANAAEKAGMGTGITDFPWKTHMWFEETGEVTVRSSYGAETKQI